MSVPRVVQLGWTTLLTGIALEVSDGSRTVAILFVAAVTTIAVIVGKGTPMPTNPTPEQSLPRCKTCRHWTSPQENPKVWGCSLHDWRVTAMGYCSAHSPKPTKEDR
jgi:hypothetical protein